jgi:hypothetical protein
MCKKTLEIVRNPESIISQNLVARLLVTKQTLQFLMRKFEVFDLFPKVNEDFALRTRTGGLISLVTLTFMAVVIAVEFNNREPDTITQQAARFTGHEPEKSEIFLNITIAYPCQILRIRIHDNSGNHQMESDQLITRQRLDKWLKPIAPPLFDGDPESIFSQCADCHGSGYTMCCLTCFDVAAAFKLENKLVPNLNNVGQCKRDWGAIADGETCRITAELGTRFRSGQLLISVGGNIQMPVHYKHDLTYYQNSANLSHWIDTLRWGPVFKGLVNPLDNSQYSQRGEGFYFFHYKLSLVPTIGWDERGKPVQSQQYSAAFSEKAITKTVSKRFPALAFEFDTAPVVVKFVSKTGSVLKWITGLLAMVGGGFTLGGLVDSFWFRVNRKKDR